MDLKLVFLILVLVVSAYRMEVNRDEDDFAVVVCKRFPLSRSLLYELVTTASMVEKWIDWMPTFMEADQKRLGVGKQFKAFYHDNAGATVFKVTGFDEGNYLVVESNFLFSPRVELYFFEEHTESLMGLEELKSSKRHGCIDKTIKNQLFRESSELGVRITINSNSALFQHIVGISVRAFLRREIIRLIENFQEFSGQFLKWQQNSLNVHNHHLE